MSNRHSVFFRPEPVKPVRYRTRRTLGQRLRPLLVGLVIVGLGALTVTGIASVVARLYVTQAQLDAAFLQGLANGQTMCGGR